MARLPLLVHRIPPPPAARAQFHPLGLIIPPFSTVIPFPCDFPPTPSRFDFDSWLTLSFFWLSTPASSWHHLPMHHLPDRPRSPILLLTRTWASSFRTTSPLFSGSHAPPSLCEIYWWKNYGTRVRMDTTGASQYSLFLVDGITNHVIFTHLTPAGWTESAASSPGMP